MGLRGVAVPGQRKLAHSLRVGTWQLCEQAVVRTEGSAVQGATEG